MKFLLVDDSRSMRNIVKDMLKESSFEFLEANNGQEGLEVLGKTGKADIALVDWNMPLMNGYDFVCAVRANPNYNSMLIMMVTTEAEMAQVIKALNAGANEYIMKPFVKEVFIDKLKTMGVSVA